MDLSSVYSLMLDLSPDVAPKYGVNPTLLAQLGTAIARKESKFNPAAKNRGSSAKGLMQILDGTKAEVEKKYAKVSSAPASKMYDARYNAMLGLHYLGYQMKRYKGDVDKAVHAYNQGSFPGVHEADGVAYRNSVREYFNQFFGRAIAAGTENQEWL